MKSIGQPHMVVFWFLVVPALVCLGLFGALDMATPDSRPASQVRQVSAASAAVSSPLLASPRLTSITATVVIEQLSVLGSVPPSNEPTEFGASQALVVPQEWSLTVLGRFTTVLTNGVQANFLVVDNGGQRVLVFFRMIDGRLTTSVGEGAFASLPEVSFP